jgi:hypothetical protein
MSQVRILRSYGQNGRLQIGFERARWEAEVDWERPEEQVSRREGGPTVFLGNRRPHLLGARTWHQGGGVLRGLDPQGQGRTRHGSVPKDSAQFMSGAKVKVGGPHCLFPVLCV